MGYVKKWQLDDWATRCQRIRSWVGAAGRQIKQQSSLELTQTLLDKSQEEALQLMQMLVEAGAFTPQMLPAPAEIPEHLLNTQTKQRLINALSAARELATALDLERGWAEGGWSDTVKDVIRELEREKTFLS